ncbi:MAG: VOC family protein [Pseudomonadota bacterium]
MIIANLTVANIARSVGFYRDVIGLEVMMVLGPGNTMLDDPDIPNDAVFAALSIAGSQLMLQTRAYARSVVPDGDGDAGTSWIYIRDLDPSPILERLTEPPLKGPEHTWYGMKEIHLRDPDGHVVCVGMPEGAGPR